MKELGSGESRERKDKPNYIMREERLTTERIKEVGKNLKTRVTRKKING